MKKQVKAFKNELKNYYFYLEKEIKLKELIDYCWHMLGADTKSIDPSRERITGGVPNKNYEYKVRNEIDKHEGNLKNVRENINHIESVLSLMEEQTREQTKKVYCDEIPMRKVAEDNFMALATLQKHIDKEIELALEILDTH